MCGIMAYKGKGSVDKVYSGLKKLEYRGYDSCGIGCKSGGVIDIYKTIGYISNLSSTGVLGEVDSELSIGHTRWATHGGVTTNNSHPHASESGAFVVVHNGILENYLDLKSQFLSSEKFSSETDSEVIPHLIEKNFRGNVWEAFVETIGMLEGSFAIVMICRYDSNVYFARKSSPLIISKSGDAFALASDILGFDDKSAIHYVNDNSIGYIDEYLHVFDNNLSLIDVNWCDCSNVNRDNVLGEWPHYMLKEIYQIPATLRSAFDSIRENSFKLPKVIDNVLIIGCGTSYHSGLMGCKYIEKVAKIKSECILASEFIYNDYLCLPNTLAIFISQSGETADTLTALKKAKSMGIYTLAITNVPSSSITRICDSVIYLNVGAEVCVASTKAYTSQVFQLLMLSNILLNNAKGNYLDDTNKSINEDNINNNEPVQLTLKDFANEEGDIHLMQDCVIVDWSHTINYLNISKGDLDQLFNINVAEIDEKVKEIEFVFENLSEVHLIGKDYDYVTSQEGALKIKEVSYIFTDAYACGELKHGTLSLIEEGSVVIALMTQNGVILEKSKNAIHEITARGGKCIAITQFDKNNCGECDMRVELPMLNDLFMPIVSIIPIDLLAYRLSITRGINPDKPRNLAKSVTVE